jgi:hypothetical protein
MDDDLTITSVVFGEKWIEIGFYESRDQSSDVIDLKQRLINPRLFPEDLAPFIDVARLQAFGGTRSDRGGAPLGGRRLHH